MNLSDNHPSEPSREAATVTTSRRTLVKAGVAGTGGLALRGAYVKPRIQSVNVKEVAHPSADPPPKSVKGGDKGKHGVSPGSGTTPGPGPGVVKAPPAPANSGAERGSSASGTNAVRTLPARNGGGETSGNQR